MPVFADRLWSSKQPERNAGTNGTNHLSSERKSAPYSPSIPSRLSQEIKMTPSPDTSSSLLHVASNTPLPDDSSSSLRGTLPSHTSPPVYDSSWRANGEQSMQSAGRDILEEDSYLGRYEGDESADVNASENSALSDVARGSPQAAAQRFVFKPKEQTQDTSSRLSSSNTSSPPDQRNSVPQTPFTRWSQRQQPSQMHTPPNAAHREVSDVTASVKQSILRGPTTPATGSSVRFGSRLYDDGDESRISASTHSASGASNGSGTSRLRRSLAASPTPSDQSTASPSTIASYSMTMREEMEREEVDDVLGQSLSRREPVVEDDPYEDADEADVHQQSSRRHVEEDTFEQSRLQMLRDSSVEDSSLDTVNQPSVVAHPRLDALQRDLNKASLPSVPSLNTLAEAHEVSRTIGLADESAETQRNALDADSSRRSSFSNSDSGSAGQRAQRTSSSPTIRLRQGILAAPLAATQASPVPPPSPPSAYPSTLEDMSALIDESMGGIDEGDESSLQGMPRPYAHRGSTSSSPSVLPQISQAHHESSVSAAAQHAALAHQQEPRPRAVHEARDKASLEGNASISRSFDSGEFSFNQSMLNREMAKATEATFSPQTLTSQAALPGVTGRRAVSTSPTAVLKPPGVVQPPIRRTVSSSSASTPGKPDDLSQQSTRVRVQGQALGADDPSHSASRREASPLTTPGHDRAAVYLRAPSSTNVNRSHWSPASDSHDQSPQPTAGHDVDVSVSPQDISRRTAVSSMFATPAASAAGSAPASAKSFHSAQVGTTPLSTSSESPEANGSAHKDASVSRTSSSGESSRSDSKHGAHNDAASGRRTPSDRPSSAGYSDSSPAAARAARRLEPKPSGDLRSSYAKAGPSKSERASSQQDFGACEPVDRQQSTTPPSPAESRFAKLSAEESHRERSEDEASPSPGNNDEVMTQWIAGQKEFDVVHSRRSSLLLKRCRAAEEERDQLMSALKDGEATKKQALVAAQTAQQSHEHSLATVRLLEAERGAHKKQQAQLDHLVSKLKDQLAEHQARLPDVERLQAELARERQERAIEHRDMEVRLAFAHEEARQSRESSPAHNQEEQRLTGALMSRGDFDLALEEARKEIREECERDADVKLYALERDHDEAVGHLEQRLQEAQARNSQEEKLADELRVEQLQDEIERLQSALADAEQATKEREDENGAARSRVEHDAHAREQRMQIQIDNLHLALRSAKQESDIQKEERSKLEEALAAGPSNSEVEDLRFAKQEAHDQVEALRKEISLLWEKLTTGAGERDNLLQQKKHLEQELKKAATSNEQAESNAQSHIAELERQVVKQEHELASLRQLAERCEEAEAEVRELEAARNSLVHEVDAALERVERERVESRKQMEKASIGFKERIDKLSEQLVQVQHERNELEQRLRSSHHDAEGQASEHIDRLQDVIKRLEQNYETVLKERRSLETQAAEAQAEYEQLQVATQTASERYQNHLDELEADGNEARQEVVRLEGEREKLERKTSELQANHQSLLQSLTELEDHNSQLETRLQKEQKARAGSMSSEEDLPAHVTEKIERLHQKLRHLEREAGDRVLEISKLNKAREKLEISNSNFAIALSAKQQELSLLKRTYSIKGTTETPAQRAPRASMPNVAAAAQSESEESELEHKLPQLERGFARGTRRRITTGPNDLEQRRAARAIEDQSAAHNDSTPVAKKASASAMGPPTRPIARRPSMASDRTNSSRADNVSMSSVASTTPQSAPRSAVRRRWSRVDEATPRAPSSGSATPTSSARTQRAARSSDVAPLSRENLSQASRPSSRASSIASSTSDVRLTSAPGPRPASRYSALSQDIFSADDSRASEPLGPQQEPSASVNRSESRASSIADDTDGRNSYRSSFDGPMDLSELTDSVSMSERDSGAQPATRPTAHRPRASRVSVSTRRRDSLRVLEEDKENSRRHARLSSAPRAPTEPPSSVGSNKLNSVPGMGSFLEKRRAVLKRRQSEMHA
ncbi:MYOSIN [Ceraceosorus bombacis]|uniref:MYOSIN n=1 Tax=Ceraceosorus bombacis TaxID=401625 RepID=A0A0P1BQX3_9BASI|nr:MYOSIN [Ceraceosorus bombacis]